ncbi:MAG: hypothetical protein IPF87_00380 [Gemmatimonadetes bacterium]|jgi:hypothetical protein|nr:hypothetical protein [Gemmatimonadota bacterium]MBP9106403.1 hypothetical protein [Gemmatimonadaceae bacterium]MBK6454531.1 hypothetical protein [Gemmatimonadota bacterium]MBK6840738.1 hypothetical protein [Gemmatimonadota bacterium]MBK7834416.1 hypothetical protein [Gemmatimonadota bacterium]
MPQTDSRPTPRAHRNALQRATHSVTRWPSRLIAALLLTACGSDIGVSTTEPVTGPGTVYTLASANDISIPATFTVDGTNVEIRKGALTLGTDSSYIFSIAIRSSVNGSTPSNGTTTLRGPFHRNGTTLVLVQQSDTMFVGTYTPNNISLLRGAAVVTGNRFVFSR